MSIDRGMNKIDAIHIQSGILLSHKKNEAMPFAANMDGPRDYHTKWRMSEKDIIWYHMYVKSKKNNTNELAYKTDSQISKASLSLWKGG